jgi:hypothetical protein
VKQWKTPVTSPCPQVHAKALALPGHVFDAALAQAVVVQARLADADHAGQLTAADQVIDSGLLHAFVVGVHAHRGPDVRALLRHRVHLRELFQRGADAQGAVHLVGGHVGQHKVELALVVGEIEVAVGIDEHGSGKSQARQARDDA